MVYETSSTATYIVESFGCTLSTPEMFTKQLQELINRYACEGWKLHSFELIHGDVCVVVFYKEQN